MSLSINKNINTVVIAQPAASLTITDNRRGTTVTISRAPDIITVTNLSGIQGPKGDTGAQGPAGLTAQTGSFFISASVANAVITFTKGDSSTSAVTVNNVQNAVTASYALNAASGDSFRIITGSIIAQVNTTNELFLIKSASANFVTVNSTGAMTLQNDSSLPFLIKATDNRSIFYVSQSGVIVTATSSVELTTTAPNGGIYFTSSSFFVGLD